MERRIIESLKQELLLFAYHHVVLLKIAQDSGLEISAQIIDDYKEKLKCIAEVLWGNKHSNMIDAVMDNVFDEELSENN